MQEEILEADVLCIGGGIAGLMAAIRASESGAKVIIAEKGNTLRSGAGGMGTDHFRSYIPEIHGDDIQPIVDEVAQSQVGGLRTRSFVHKWMEKSFDIVKLWDSWGIPMRPNGKWEFSGHAFPGRPVTTQKYAGLQQKPIMTMEARKRGVKIMNRVMVFDLLVDDNGIIGAVGVSTRDDKVIIFRAKSVILGTGRCMRLYLGATPGCMFNMSHSPATTGDGRAMAYRAGAELINLEMPYKHAGPKYFARCGKGTWIGVVRDSQEKPIGPFVTKPDRHYGDNTVDVYHSVFEDYAKSGRGPTYMDCRGISDEDYEYMRWGLSNEGNNALLNHLDEEKIDITKQNSVEFMTYELTSRGGIYFNEKSETSMKGLYAAGDEYASGVSSAAVFGWIAGDNAAEYIKNARTPDIDIMKDKIEEKKELFKNIRARQTGATWKEVNIAIQQVMHDYAGSLRSQALLEAGLSQLRRLKEKTYSTMIASNPHELMHCLEVLNLLDVGELVFITAMERKESRGKHVRVDYPFTNPVLNNKVLKCKRVNGKPSIVWS